MGNHCCNKMSSSRNSSNSKLDSKLDSMKFEPRHFQGNEVKPVPESLHPGFLFQLRVMNVVATTELCNVPFKWSPPTNQHPTFYRPDSLLFLLPNFNSIKALKSIRRFNFEDRTAKALTASSRSRLYCFNFDCSFSIVSRSISLAFSSSSLICVSSWTRRSSRRTAF